jgi:hypothetical protein
MAVLTYTPIFAHFGHWYISVPTFATPVVILAIWVKVSERRALRRAREGDTSRVPVVVTEQQNRTTLTVQGEVSYLTLLDIEHELGVAAARDLPVLLDLRGARPTEDEFAWSIVEVIRTIEDADITVLVGSAEALGELSKVATLEGVRVIDDPGAMDSLAPAEQPPGLG